MKKVANLSAQIYFDMTAQAYKSKRLYQLLIALCLVQSLFPRPVWESSIKEKVGLLRLYKRLPCNFWNFYTWWEKAGFFAIEELIRDPTENSSILSALWRTVRMNSKCPCIYLIHSNISCNSCRQNLYRRSCIIIYCSVNRSWQHQWENIIGVFLSWIICFMANEQTQERSNIFHDVNCVTLYASTLTTCITLAIWSDSFATRTIKLPSCFGPHGLSFDV